MAGTPQLRNAFIMQGLTCALLIGAGVTYYFLGKSDDTAYTFVGVGGITALVLCLWSLIVSIRAARSGARWRWAAVIWLLVGIELVSPSAYYWYKTEGIEGESFYLSILFAVALPWLLVTGMYAGLGAILIRKLKRVKIALLITLLLYLPVVLIIVPAAVFMIAALSRNFYQRESPAQAVIHATPLVFRDNLDRALAVTGSGKLFELHLLLCREGLLSRTRSLEILDSPDADSIWLGLEVYEPAMGRSIAMDLAHGKLPHTQFMNAVDRHMGSSIVRGGRRDEVIELFKQLPTVPAGMRLSMVQGLYFDYRLANEIVLHRIYTTPDMLRAFHGTMLWTLKWVGETSLAPEIVSNWAATKTPEEIQKDVHFNAIIKTCRESQNPVVRRVAVTALADILNLELHHVPFADAGTKDGKPVPVSLDESEEIVSVCNAAEAAAAKISVSTKP